MLLFSALVLLELDTCNNCNPDGEGLRQAGESDLLVASIRCALVGYPDRGSLPVLSSFITR